MLGRIKSPLSNLRISTAKLPLLFPPADDWTDGADGLLMLLSLLTWMLLKIEGNVKSHAVEQSTPTTNIGGNKLS